MNVINALDLDAIKVKLMHKESGEGWSLERANAVEFEYRRFLTLMKKYPHEQTSPLVDVDTFWHYHILDTMKYAEDCQAVFGYFLHHFPYVGMRGDADEASLARIGQRMKELYEAEFGEDYVRPAQRAFEGATQANAFCGSPEQANAFCGSPEKQANAFCGSPDVRANAFCGSPEKQANAFCGSPEKQANAFCGSPEKQANAFCGSPEKQANAFCGSPEKMQANAFCGSPEKQANAFCGSPEEKVAFCGSPEKAVSAKVPNQPGLFSGRPTLS